MITEIEIRNFRSIERMKLKCTDITTFIGENDAGKSNILRALNLFFNDETDYGQPFDFDRDWNRNAKTIQRKAQEIRIVLTLKLPENYIQKGLPRFVTWRKIWRKNGLQNEKEKQIYTDYQLFKGRSKIPMLLSRIRFHYVPAIKDRNFFAKLQGDLYEVLAEVTNKKLLGSARSFEKSIKTELEKLHDAGNDIMGSPSSLKLPGNLRSIFEILQFSGEDGIPLQQRGDGIQIRHIPEILKFMGEKHNSMRLQGTPGFTYIWGFEEPENSVEMNACFKMKETLESIISESRSTKQIFLTTHSPIFCQIKIGKNSDEKTHSHFIKKLEGDHPHSEAKLVTDPEELGKDMGLMLLVAPYIEKERNSKLEAERALREAERALKNVELMPSLFVEGKWDRLVIEKALSLFFPKETKQIRVIDCGNNHKAINHAKAWSTIRVNLPAVALTDRDRKKANSSYRPPSEKIICLKWEPDNLPDDLAALLPADLESCYSDKIWEHAYKQRQWLKPSTRSVEVRLFSKNPNLSSEKRIMNQFTEIGKKEAANYIIKLNDDDAKEALIAMEPTLKKAVQHLVTKKAN